MALFRDLQSNQQTLVLHTARHVEPRPIVSDGRFGGPVDYNAGLRDAVGGQRRTPVACFDAGGRTRLGPRPVSQRSQRYAVAYHRLVLQPFQPAQGASVGA